MSLIADHIKIRVHFYKALFHAMHIVWPIFSGLILAIIGLGLLVGYLEAWKPMEGIYFSFITALTVGYGDFIPKQSASRFIAILIGFTGTLLTALFAAISVRALTHAIEQNKAEGSQTSQSPNP